MAARSCRAAVESGCRTCIPHHLLQDRSSSPLSDIPPTSGSRSRRLSRSQIRRNYRRLRTHVSKAQLIMSPHWRLSRAKCSSTGYRGRKLRKSTKVMEFCRNLIEKGKRAAFLAAFRTKGYRVVPCPRCVYYFLHHLQFPLLKLGNLLGIDLSSFSMQIERSSGWSSLLLMTGSSPMKLEAASKPWRPWPQTWHFQNVETSKQ